MEESEPKSPADNDASALAMDEMRGPDPDTTPPGYIWVLGRLEDKNKLKLDVERIAFEAGQSAKRLGIIQDRQTLLSLAREHHFTLDQLKLILPDDAFAGLVQQLPLEVIASALPSSLASDPPPDTPAPSIKIKGRPSGMRRLFSSKREESFEYDPPNSENGSPRPSFSSIPRTPPMARKISDLTSPESFGTRSTTSSVLFEATKCSDLDLPVFVYGINMFPNLLGHNANIPASPQTLLESHMCPAELSHFLRVRVKRADQPAIVSVAEPSSRLKAELTFKTQELFPGRRWCNYVAAGPTNPNARSSARSLEPLGTVGESFKTKAVCDPVTGLVTKLDELSHKVPVHPDDVFDLAEHYTPPSVKGMLVFGLDDAQRARLDHACGYTTSAGMPLSTPLYKKERVIVDFSIRVEKQPSTPLFASGPEYIPSNPSSSSKQALNPSSRKPIAPLPSPPGPPPISSTRTKRPPLPEAAQPYDPNTITFDPSIDPRPLDPKQHPLFKPDAALTDAEYDAFTALDRRWRAACIKWTLRPQIAAIHAEEQSAERADKMRKMDLIMGIMDAHQRDVEDVASGSGEGQSLGVRMANMSPIMATTSTPHSSLGSEVAAALAASSFRSSSSTTPSLERVVEYELVPLHIEAWAYVWAGSWGELESPLEHAWDEAVYY